MHNLRDIIANLFIYNKPSNAESIIINNDNTMNDISRTKIRVASSNIRQDVINQNYAAIQQGCPCHRRYNNNTANDHSVSYQRSQKALLPRIYFNQSNNNSRSQDFNAINRKYIRDQEELIKQIKESNETKVSQLQPYRNRTYVHIPARVYENNYKRQPEDMKHDYYNYDESKLPLRQKQHSAAYINVKKKPDNILLGKLHKDYGKTPEYLLKKKEEYKEQKEYEKLREKEKKLPKGMRIMPEEARVAKIKELNELKKELEYELSQMPIARISMKKLLRKGEIESMLKMIDTELARYSLKEVIIPIETLI